MRVNTNVSNKTRRELVLDDFKGVDFSSSPLKVSGSRASFASNLICDNGVNHKRPGWESMLEYPACIYGIYFYQNGKHRRVIIYCGGYFWGAYPRYKPGQPSDKFSIGNDGCEKLSETQFTPGKVQFFQHKERLYIIGCGDYLVYGTWDEGASYELRRVVDDEDTYVPTVITGATPLVQEYKYLKDYNTYDWVTYQEATPGEVLDKLNILRTDGRRKNLFINKFQGASDNYYRTYTTDTIFTNQSKVKISVNDVPYIFSASDQWADFGNGKIQFYNPMADGKYIGFQTRGKSPDTEVDAHIVVEYTPAEYADESKLISSCIFGTRFGAYGNSDRLFLSGNPDMPNADFYSEFDDFTYFTAESQTVMGSDDVPITGYLRLSDSTLATLKAETFTEPTIYYRTATELEEDGATKIAFTRWTGGINEGCVNPYCTTLFADDNLMLSPNGVRGIVQISNTATNERYIRERDKFINSDLIKHDLSNAVGIVYKNRYYLAVDGVCYVADPRYKTYVKDDIDGSFNYEWWYWENIPASVFAIVNGELWFGTEEGMICRFDDKFTDRTYEYSLKGDVSLSDDNKITYSENLKWIEEGQQITLLGAKEKNELYIVNIEPNSDDVGGTFQLALHKDCDYESGVVTIKDYFDEVPDTFLVRVNYPLNVVSKWFSPVFDLGAFDVSKTLLSMSITVDPTVRGKVQFGYDTRDCEKTILRNSLGEGYFDYDAINFSDFSFEANFAASHTVRVKDRNFNYITFKLISDNDKDCAVCNLKAVYQYNGRLKGVH